MNTLRKPVNNIIAMELIQQQNDNFPTQLEFQVNRINDKLLSGEYKASTDIGKKEEAQAIVKLVKERIGLNIKLITNSSDAAVLPFYSNNHHIFINKFWRGMFTIKDQEEILKKANNKTGWVDTKKAKLGGIFSEYLTPVYINFNVLLQEYEMLPGEVAAVILHELGHAFYACEYSDRMESTNQVLADIANKLAGDDVNKKTYIFKEANKISDNISQKDIDALVDGNRIIAGYNWFKIVIGSVKSQMFNDKYEESSFEQSADNFASRFGYGRQLVGGLDKLLKHYGSLEKMKYGSFAIPFAIQLFYAMLMCSVIISSPIVGVLFGALAIYSGMTIFSQGGKDLTYDELKIRYKRIRHDKIELLKTSELPSEQIKAILEDIYLIDKFMDETYRIYPLIGRIGDLLIPSFKKAKSSITEQQILEELSFNDFFVKSKELSVA